MRNRLAAALVALPMIVTAGCATPGAGAPSASPSAVTSSADSSPSSTAPAPTTSAPPSTTEASSTTPPSSAPQDTPKPGAEPWPPELILGDILEAGTTTVQTGKVSVMLPGGFAESQPGTYTSTWPGAKGPSTITISAAAAEGDAMSELTRSQKWARKGEVEIPNASSAAIADAVVGGVKTWGLVVIDSAGTATTLTFSAAPQDFDDYLLYQSLCSTKVAA